MFYLETKKLGQPYQQIHCVHSIVNCLVPYRLAINTQHMTAITGFCGFLWWTEWITNTLKNNTTLFKSLILSSLILSIPIGKYLVKKFTNMKNVE